MSHKLAFKLEAARIMSNLRMKASEDMKQVSVQVSQDIQENCDGGVRDLLELFNDEPLHPHELFGDEPSQYTSPFVTETQDAAIPNVASPFTFVTSSPATASVDVQMHDSKPPAKPTASAPTATRQATFSFGEPMAAPLVPHDDLDL